MLPTVLVSWTAVTKYRLGGLNNSSGGWKSKVKMSAGLVSSETPHLGLQVAVFFLCLHIIFHLHMSMSKFPFLMRTVLMMSFSLNYPFNNPISANSHVLSYWELGHKNWGMGTQFRITPYSPWGLKIQAYWKVSNYSWCSVNEPPSLLSTKIWRISVLVTFHLKFLTSKRASG